MKEPDVTHFLPREGDSCRLIIFHKSGTLSQDFPLEYQLSTEFEIIIGESDTEQGIQIETVINRMRVGQAQTFHFLSSAVMEVKLLYLKPGKDIWKMEITEKLQQAKWHKLRGIKLFKEKKTEAAFWRFSKAAKYLVTMGQTLDIPDSILEEWRTLKYQVYLNLSACQLQYNSYEDVVVNCSKALEIDPHNVKGLFRQGQAFIKLKRYDSAQSDLEKALELEPNNKAIQNKLALVKSHLKTDNVHLSAVMSKLFT